MLQKANFQKLDYCVSKPILKTQPNIVRQISLVINYEHHQPKLSTLWLQNSMLLLDILYSVANCLSIMQINF